MNVKARASSAPCMPPWANASFERGGAVEEWELPGAVPVLADSVVWELAEWLPGCPAEVAGELDGRVGPVV